MTRQQAIRQKRSLPYGSGSIQFRGAVWWLVYRDANGKVIQENSLTADADEALRMLVSRSTATLRARIDQLEAIANEPAPKATGQGQRAPRGGAERPSGRKPVRRDSEGRTQRNRAEKRCA